MSAVNKICHGSNWFSTSILLLQALQTTHCVLQACMQGCQIFFTTTMRVYANTKHCNHVGHEVSNPEVESSPLQLL